MPVNHWDIALTEPTLAVEQLTYRSNLLGRDRTVCNWGGGNTSTKAVETDFRGRTVEVMWVKGSGSDLATAKPGNFTALALNDVLPLMQRESMTDEEMVAYLTHCMLDAKHPRMSIETLLHAFLPYRHVDHTHPDAIISLCCAGNGKQIAREIYGDRFVWVPYIRPGFTLSKMIAEGVAKNPRAELVLMEKHGLVTWGDTSAECYRRTIETIQRAEDYIAGRVERLGDKLFGGTKRAPLEPDARKSIAARIMPIVRGLVSADSRMILNFDDGDDVLRFAGSRDASGLTQVGAACPDHLVHTKRIPLYIDWNPSTQDVPALIEALKTGIDSYSTDYRRYFEAHASAGDVMFSAGPRVILIPGIGMITTGKDKAMAEVSAALYHRAIAVMSGSTALGDFVSLDAAESFAVEYWPLELYKLSMAPPEAEFSRKVALVTGGGGGIGTSTAKTLARDGAHVVIADINYEAAEKTAAEVNAACKGAPRARAVKVDVTQECAVKNAFDEAILYYGGIDILVNNAGLATSNPFTETTLDEWNLNFNVLSTGYFLAAREAFKIMKDQQIGGAIVFVGSKNSIYAGKNAAAYSTAKAAELHLARCLAAEGGELGIRVNTVLPDAVLQGSTIWNGTWRNERAAAYGIEPDQLEEYYRKRTTLLANVLPDDVANAIVFLAGSQSAKTTGCFITVDAGVPAAFAR